MKQLKLLLVAILAIGFTTLGVHSLVSHQKQLKLKSIQLNAIELEINTLQLKQKELNNKIKDTIEVKEINEEKVRRLEKEKLELENKQQELEKQLQAKRSTEMTQVSEHVYAAESIKGNKQDWLRASGIPEDEWWAVDYIVSRESGWNPCAYYPGQSNCNASPTTACGLVQQNPCGKIQGHWTDPVAALKWQANYVQKYGGYSRAVEYWKVHGHY